MILICLNKLVVILHTIIKIVAAIAHITIPTCLTLNLHLCVKTRNRLFWGIQFYANEYSQKVLFKRTLAMRQGLTVPGGQELLVYLFYLPFEIDFQIHFA
jgi:hypothetical protein